MRQATRSSFTVESPWRTRPKFQVAWEPFLCGLLSFLSWHNRWGLLSLCYPGHVRDCVTRITGRIVCHTNNPNLCLLFLGEAILFPVFFSPERRIFHNHLKTIWALFGGLNEAFSHWKSVLSAYNLAENYQDRIAMLLRRGVSASALLDLYKLVGFKSRKRSSQVLDIASSFFALSLLRGSRGKTKSLASARDLKSK